MNSRTDDMRMIRQGLGLPAEPTVAGVPIPGPPPGAAPMGPPPPGALPPGAPAHGPPPGGPWAGGSPPGMYPTVTDWPPAHDPRARDRAPWGPQRAPGPRPAGRDPRAGQRPILSGAALTSVPVIVYAGLALIVIGTAILTGFKVRSTRLDGQIEAAREAADGAASSDTYVGYLIALDTYGRIAAAAGDDESAAAHAAMAARMAAEVGDGLSLARRLVSGLGQDSDLPDALAARGFLAVAEEDGARATAAATRLRQIAPEHPDALHLAGRAALLSERPTDAAQLLRAALEKRPRPAIAVALARAEAGQGRFAEAGAALERAFKIRPKHAAATVWAARIAVWGKNFPSRAGEPEASLDAIIQEGARPPAAQTMSASPGQGAWAALALAEVKLARGDRAGAQAALGAAQAAQAQGGFAFRSALAEMLVDLGELAAARAQVELAVKEWPKSVVTRTLEARVAMASGDPGAALAALEKAGDLSRHPEAMALRGRARLATGSTDQAAADLDAALALRADQQGAILARAEVDLARGDARVARKRLSPLYGDGSGAPVEVVVAYAESQRLSGDRTEARRTLSQLGDRRPGEAADWRVLVEQARLARADGQFKSAAERYAKAIAAAPRALDARLESADLALDTGDVRGARAQLDAVVNDAGQSGPLLAAAAQVHILTGDHKGAAELLDRAGRLPSPGSIVARERGRLLLRQRHPEQAAEELQRSRSLAPDGGETRLLLMEAYLLGKSRKAAGQELLQLTKTFRGTPLLALARGLEALTRERWRDAAQELERAHKMAIDDGESPRELGRVAYWCGRAYYLDDKVSRAVDWLTRAIDHDPSLADAHFLLGQIAFEGRRRDKAKMVKRFERAVAIDPSGNPSAWFFLGEHYAADHRNDRARQALQTYLDSWPKGDFAADARDLLAKLR
jgi:tetratricopeptide (TPR) repeat protein